MAAMELPFQASVLAAGAAHRRILRAAGAHEPAEASERMAFAERVQTRPRFAQTMADEMLVLAQLRRLR